MNYPSSEYLELPFLDVLCLNVYLETPEKLRAYLAHLQNLAGDRPLIMGEIGLDSLRNGEDHQARTLTWQIASIFAGGAAGAFVFAWTDEWHRGGELITDWRFGLTGPDRSAKPALSAVRDAFARTPVDPDTDWPMISVIVCTYNGQRTLAECLDGISRLDYPNYEVIVVNDGSTDATASIAATYDCRLINIANGGLSKARNVGMVAACGQIIAYIDDDAFPDRDWLKFLAHTFLSTDHAVVGGPNIPPGRQGRVADCVSRAPGGPSHVLLTHTLAEHVPGCNMAFRRDRLLEVGGFDPRFRIAGDDVDICWRILQRGWTIGFCPGAMVWHHRRNAVKVFFKQQFNYGKAEAMLEQKWPDKYNAAGHLRWGGRIYGGCLSRTPRSRIYQGTWGSAPFQSVYHPSPGIFGSLPSMPEWYLVMLGLMLGVLASSVWGVLAVCLLPLTGMLAATGAQAMFYAGRSMRLSRNAKVDLSWRVRGLTAWLHIIQPAARLLGRLSMGLTPWRRRGCAARGLVMPRTRHFAMWYPKWRAPEDRLQMIEACLQRGGAVVRRGGNFDSWDMEVRGGLFGAARLQMTIEEHGQGFQLVRFRVRPRCNGMGILLMALFVPGVLAATGQFGSWSASAPIYLAGAMLLLLAPLRDVASAIDAAIGVLAPMADENPLPAGRARRGIDSQTAERFAEPIQTAHPRPQPCDNDPIAEPEDAQTAPT